MNKQDDAHEKYLRTIDQLLSQPTAPFHEQAMIRRIRSWADEHGLAFASDAVGNVVLRYAKAPAGRQHWVFAAHMDHPGFVTTARRGRTVQADFIGYVDARYFKGSSVRLFAPDGEITARVTSIRKAMDGAFPSCRLQLDRAADVPPGTVGMWNLPHMKVSGRRLASRACDDVVGCASVLCAMGEIAAAGVKANVTALLTRAEEAGFIGAMAACREGTLDKDSLIVAIETSKATSGAALGGGVVVRVGDRARTFDPSLTAHLADVAAGLARKDKAFRYTRQLMPGGTCESTAYAMWGLIATGLCIPLGNYHNMGPGDKIATEQVDLDDFASLVKLLVAIAKDNRNPADTDKTLKKRLDTLLKQRGKLLVKS